MERLGSAEGSAGQLGNKERARCERARAEAPGGTGPGCRPPGVGLSVSAADERAAFQLRARSGAFLAAQRGFPAGAGPAERLHLHKVPARRPGGAAGRGRAASEPGRERKGGCGPRCLGNGNIPLGAAQRNTDQVTRQPHTRLLRGAPQVLAPSPCTRAVPPSQGTPALRPRVCAPAPAPSHCASPCAPAPVPSPAGERLCSEHRASALGRRLRSSRSASEGR